MKIIISTQGKTAIYEQIVKQMQASIVSGEVGPGELLPSIRSLASDLQVSVITTKRVYEELEKEGLIRSVAGKGFYVSDVNRDYLKEKQLISIESQLLEAIVSCKKAGLTEKEVIEMVKTLYGEA